VARSAHVTGYLAKKKLVVARLEFDVPALKHVDVQCITLIFSS
jgi:hypothetical protein